MAARRGRIARLPVALEVAGVTTELAEPFFDILNGLFWAWQLAIQWNAVHS